MRHTGVVDLLTAWAKATGASDRRMRRYKRRTWNQADYRFAVRLMDRLVPDPE